MCMQKWNVCGCMYDKDNVIQWKMERTMRSKGRLNKLTRADEMYCGDGCYGWGHEWWQAAWMNTVCAMSKIYKMTSWPRSPNGGRLLTLINETSFLWRGQWSFENKSARGRSWTSLIHGWSYAFEVAYVYIIECGICLCREKFDLAHAIFIMDSF